MLDNGVFTAVGAAACRVVLFDHHSHGIVAESAGGLGHDDDARGYQSTAADSVSDRPALVLFAWSVHVKEFIRSQEA